MQQVGSIQRTKDEQVEEVDRLGPLLIVCIIIPEVQADHMGDLIN